MRGNMSARMLFRYWRPPFFFVCLWGTQIGDPKSLIFTMASAPSAAPPSSVRATSASSAAPNTASPAQNKNKMGLIGLAAEAVVNKQAFHNHVRLNHYHAGQMNFSNTSTPHCTHLPFFLL